MLQFTLIVKMTGLLLLTPHTPVTPGSLSSGRPTYVLMPNTARVDSLHPHVAQVGYRSGKEERHCAWYQDGICYVNMDGWSMEIGRPGNISSVMLPGGAANVSSVVNRRVNAAQLGNRPGRRVRSRVTLHAGAVDSTCALGWWRFASRRDSLSNVVYWRIPNLRLEDLLLTRKPLDSAANDPAAEPLAGLIPNADGQYELFIRHVPANQQEHGRGADNALPGSARHFHAFYDLLGLRYDESRPLPAFDGYVTDANKTCFWARSANKTIRIDQNPGTVSCMIARADPDR